MEQHDLHIALSSAMKCQIKSLYPRTSTFYDELFNVLIHPCENTTNELKHIMWTRFTSLTAIGGMFKPNHFVSVVLRKKDIGRKRTGNEFTKLKSAKKRPIDSFVSKPLGKIKQESIADPMPAFANNIDSKSVQDIDKEISTHIPLGDCDISDKMPSNRDFIPPET